jgi:hypothetical protein
MEIRIGWALVAGLAVGGAVFWWQSGHPGWETMDQKVARAEQAEKAKAAAEPTLYRWHDRHGVLQITDTPPPKGRKFDRVKIRDDQNIIPMSELANPPSSKTPKKAHPG